MEETTCSACGRQMTLKDLDERTFREIDGKLLCPACVAKLGQPKKMRCPHCGKQTTAILQDGIYSCRNCGKEIGGQKESGVIASALPSGVREAESNAPTPRPAAAAKKAEAEPQPVAEPPAPPAPPEAPEAEKPEPRRPMGALRRREHHAQMLIVLLSVFIAATLILGGLLIRTYLSAHPKVPSERESLDLIEKWIRVNPDERRESGIRLYDEAIKNKMDPVTTQALINKEDLQLRTKRVAEAEKKQFEELTRERDDARKERDDAKKERDDARKEADRLKGALKSAEAALAAAKGAPKPPKGAEKPGEVTGQPPTVPPVAPPVDEADAAYRTALASTQKLIAEKKYGAAMKTMEALAQRYAGTPVAKQASVERARISGDAYQAFTKISERADILIKAGDYDGARQLYAQAVEFGVDGINQAVEQRRAEIRDAETHGAKKTPEAPLTAPPAPAPPAVPAAVEKLLAGLKSSKDLERGDAALRLGDLGNPAAVAPLIDALKDTNWLVRDRAAQSLGKLKDERAVPALIALLDDRNEAVRYDSNEALKLLTGQTFSQDEKAKWAAWHGQKKTEPVTPRPAPPTPPSTPPAPAPKTGSFETKVLERKYNPDIIVFIVPPGIVLAAGAKVTVVRQGEPVCDLVIQQVANNDQAFGAASGMKADAKLYAGDPITVRLPK